MKVQVLPSGSYRVQKMIKGKKYSFTFDKKPTKADIEEAIIAATGRLNGKNTFNDCAILYIDARNNTLSPKTIREYKGMLKRLSIEFTSIAIDDLVTNDVQIEINKLAKDKSPKTVRNYNGFISTVLGEFRPDLVLHTHLPQKEKKESYIPTKEDISKLLEIAKGSDYEVAILLGCCGMRRGEICALTMDDIDFNKNVIHITKDVVIDENQNWVVKKPKTTSSIRDVVVPDIVTAAIKTNGLYQGHPNSIHKWLRRRQDEYDLPKYSFHSLRHYFASVAHEAGISDADIMAAGGWETDYVMKTVYRHSLANDTSAATTAALNGLL